MRRGGGKSKGHGFENEVAKTILKYFACHRLKRKECFRTPGSGGHRFISKLKPGDLQMSRRLQRLLPAVVECKFYKTIDPIRLLASQKAWDKSYFKRWLDQACTAAIGKTGLFPLLVFKGNHTDVYAAMPRTFAELINGNAYETFPRMLVFRYNRKQWVIVRFKALLKQFQKATKKKKK